MKAQLERPTARTKSSIAVSVAVHIVVFIGLAAITFHYPIDEIFRRPPPTKVEKITYFRVAPRSQQVAGGATRASTRGTIAPAPLPAVRSIPVGIPAPVMPTAATGVRVGAGGNGPSRAVGIADGLQPGIPDSRLTTNPMQIARMPETEGQKAERALAAIYAEYLDSARAAMAAPKGREAGDWSWGGKDGDKWGWDKAGIRVAGVTIPNVVLAALPLNISPQGRNMNALIDGRNDAYMRSDIKSHAGMMSEDEFRTAIRRTRERVDRERQERMAKAKPKVAPCCSN